MGSDLSAGGHDMCRACLVHVEGAAGCSAKSFDDECRKILPPGAVWVGGRLVYMDTSTAEEIKVMQGGWNMVVFFSDVLDVGFVRSCVEALAGGYVHVKKFEVVHDGVTGVDSGDVFRRLVLENRFDGQGLLMCSEGMMEFFSGLVEDADVSRRNC